MGIGPHRPLRDIETELGRGNLDMAAAIAKDFQRAKGRPIPLALAVRLLPLVAADRAAYDQWACHWLSRWLSEAPAATINGAADLSGMLADLPSEPSTIETILALLR